MSIGLIMLTAMMLMAVIVLVMRVGIYRRGHIVGQSWLHLIDKWGQMYPVNLLTSQNNTDDDSKMHIHLTPFENVILKESDIPRNDAIPPVGC
jgi:hypothetical protein